MAQTLEDFLISVKYAVDQPSQQRFFDGLKRVATSIGGVTAELTGLSIGLIELSKSLAKQGDAMYWMSQRLGTSIASIESASYAMANLGVSTSEAQSSMEKFGAWQRGLGVASTAFLRSMGVTAAQTDLQLEQLGRRLSMMGANAPGTTGYAIALKYAQMMGLDERQMRAIADPRFATGNQANERLQAQVWGVGAGGDRGDVRSRLQGQTDAYGVASNKIVQQFNTMGLFFETLTQKFALKLFGAVGPDLDKINKLLLEMQPRFERLMDVIISYAPQMMHFLEGMIKATATFASLLAETIQWIEKLPPAMKTGAEAIAGMKVGLDLMSSPLGRFIALFTVFMLLLDDYQQWQKNQQPGATQVRTGLDWGGFDKIIQPIKKVAKEFDDWFAKLTGIHDALEYLVGAAFAAKLLGLSRSFNLVTASVGRLAFMFTPGGLLMTGLAALAAVGIVNKFGQDKIYARAKELGWSVSGEGTSSPTFSKDGRTLNFGEMQRQLGFDPNTGMTAGQAAGVTPLPWEEGGKNFNPDGSPVVLDKDTKGVLDKIMQWGRETAEGVAKLVGHNEDVGDISQGLLQGVTPAEALAAGGVAQAGSRLTGGGPMTSQQAMSAADLRDDIAKRLGISTDQASEIVSGMKFESGLRSDISYGGGAYQYGTNIAVGLAQWTGSRHRALEAFAKSKGLDPKDRETQLQFMVHELTTNPAFANWREALAQHNWGGFYEATAGNVHGGDPWQHGRSTTEISRLPPSRAGGRQVSVNNSTSIVVQTPDPHTAGARVFAEATRIHDFQTRHSKSALA